MIQTSTQTLKPGCSSVRPGLIVEVLGERFVNGFGVLLGIFPHVARVNGSLRLSQGAILEGYENLYRLNSGVPVSAEARQDLLYASPLGNHILIRFEIDVSHGVERLSVCKVDGYLYDSSFLRSAKARSRYSQLREARSSRLCREMIPDKQDRLGADIRSVSGLGINCNIL